MYCLDSNQKKTELVMIKFDDFPKIHIIQQLVILFIFWSLWFFVK